MEKLNITTGEAKINDYKGTQYIDFLRFDNEEQIYFLNYRGYDEICINADFGETILEESEPFTVYTKCKETLSHEIILQLEEDPTKENILKTIAFINTYFDKKYNFNQA